MARSDHRASELQAQISSYNEEIKSLKANKSNLTENQVADGLRRCKKSKEKEEYLHSMFSSKLLGCIDSFGYVLYLCECVYVCVCIVD